ncbi:MAG TPA: UxaA family hydrolase [Casimicrobiaceae bacterium]|nr:UxaA family hydrolase [Casimicrobiaceae bacterium]
MIHFLVHSTADNVGVAVTAGVRKGGEVTGRVMDSGATIVVRALADIPLGHKIAVSDIEDKSTVVKYGHDIGRTIAPIRKGEHVHVHNLRTKRW